MKVTTFTDVMIRKLKPAAKEFRKSEGNGFTIRVLPSGVKTWLYLYTIDERRRCLNLGQYPDVKLEDARTLCDDARKQAKAGIDPLSVKEQAQKTHQEAPTVAKLIDEYIEKHAMPKKRSWAADKSILERDALVVWGKRKAADIKKRDVVLLLESIIDRGSPGSANNNFKIIRKMFRFAVQRDILEHSPCDGVIMPAPLNRRDRVLDESEIKTLWDNLDSCQGSEEIKRALRLVLLTAQRPGEVIGMHTNEIDGKWWTIPAERSKNKRSHRVYLTATALELIGPLEVFDKKINAMKPKGYIFPCPHEKKIKPIEVNAMAHVVRRNIEAPVKKNGKQVIDADGKPVTENRLGVAVFTPQDLRRTAATFMSQIGFMDEIIDAVLNHTKQGIIRTYNLNRYDKEKQKVLESWARKLTSITTGKKSNVLPMKRKAA